MMEGTWRLQVSMARPGFGMLKQARKSFILSIHEESKPLPSVPMESVSRPGATMEDYDSSFSTGNNWLPWPENGSRDGGPKTNAVSTCTDLVQREGW